MVHRRTGGCKEATAHMQECPRWVPKSTAWLLCTVRTGTVRAHPQIYGGLTVCNYKCGVGVHGAKPYRRLQGTDRFMQECAACCCQSDLRCHLAWFHDFWGGCGDLCRPAAAGLHVMGAPRKRAPSYVFGRSMGSRCAHAGACINAGNIQACLHDAIDLHGGNRGAFCITCGEVLMPSGVCGLRA